MAQFDVHQNRDANRDLVPYVVVRSALFDGYKRRVVVPLVRKTYLDKVATPRFHRTFTIEGAPVILQPLNVVAVATDTLTKALGSLAEQAQKIIDALEESIRRPHGGFVCST